MSLLALVYGAVCYAVFFLTFLYAVGFLGGFGVPRTLDVGGPAASTGGALAVNLALLGLFAVQHSVMARPGFKRAWTRLVPAPAERSTYVLASSLVLALLFWQWRPMPALVWEVQAPAARAVLWGLFGAGWVLVLVSTFLIDHFELFGLRQVWRHARGIGPAPTRFRLPLLYRIVRHPLYVGWLLAFWATPAMSAGHLLFALAAGGYILLAIRLEERDLRAMHPEYADYARSVPMLVPRLRRSDSARPPGRPFA